MQNIQGNNAIEYTIQYSGETLTLPWNVERMTDEDVVQLIRDINNGKIKLMLEIRDENNNLIGFKRIGSLDEIEQLNYKKCEYFENLDVDYNSIQLPCNAKMIEYRDGEFSDVVEQDGKLKQPFNTKKMTERQMMSFIKKINNGKIELELEVRGYRNQLMGFQTIMPVDKLDELRDDCLLYSKYLLSKLKKASIFGKKNARAEWVKYRALLERLNKIKNYWIDTPLDLEYELKLLESYRPEDIQIDKDCNEIYKEIHFRRV